MDMSMDRNMDMDRQREIAVVVVVWLVGVVVVWLVEVALPLGAATDVNDCSCAVVGVVEAVVGVVEAVVGVVWLVGDIWLVGVVVEAVVGDIWLVGVVLAVVLAVLVVGDIAVPPEKAFLHTGISNGHRLPYSSHLATLAMHQARREVGP